MNKNTRIAQRLAHGPGEALFAARDAARDAARELLLRVETWAMLCWSQPSETTRGERMVEDVDDFLDPSPVLDPGALTVGLPSWPDVCVWSAPSTSRNLGSGGDKPSQPIASASSKLPIET